MPISNLTRGGTQHGFLAIAHMRDQMNSALDMMAAAVLGEGLRACQRQVAMMGEMLDGESNELVVAGPQVLRAMCDLGHESPEDLREHAREVMESDPRQFGHSFDGYELVVMNAGRSEPWIGFRPTNQN